MGKKIGIYGGTFDPPHLGHMRAARETAARLKLDEILLVPARLPPHKQLPEDAGTPEQRLEMIGYIADALSLDLPCRVLDLELKRQGPSYTVDTLRELRRAHPDDELWLLMGTDMFLSFQDWREPEQIAELAHLCAFGRHDADKGAILSRQRERLQALYPHAEIRALTLRSLVDVSSTDLRHRLREGEGGGGLWPPVYGYILRNRLYGTAADMKRLELPELRAVSQSMIKAKRIAHVLGTEEEAVRLAKRWGAEELPARRAAILHDCTKYYTAAEQLQLCEKYGIVLDTLERELVKLQHALTAAALAEHVFGEPPEVCRAIRWHTTGRADMSLLEKIIYMADYIEPNRDFDGVDGLRELAYRDLDAAILAGLEMTVEEMNERGLPVHGKTLEAVAFLRGV